MYEKARRLFAKKPTMVSRVVFRWLIWGLAAFVLVHAAISSALALEAEPRVTRWMHPDQKPRPAHAPPSPAPPLKLRSITLPVMAPKPPAVMGRVCLVVHRDIRPLIQASLGGFSADLTRRGYAVLLNEYASGRAENPRAYLAALHDKAAGLTGAILIGEIPYIVYELNQDWGQGVEYEDFACDIFYMDLDGSWADILNDGGVQAGNGKYDTRGGDLNLEIWVSRMQTARPSAIGPEAAVLNDYFDKDRRYRRGRLGAAHSALVYNDDDWEYMADDDAENLEQIYDPPALFYSLYVCSGSDFTADDYLAGSVAFNPADSGLLVWGSTKTGGMWADSTFYSRLGSGDCFGAAFKAWFNEVQGIYASTIVDKWWYGMVLIGDATLVPRLEPLPASLAPVFDLLLNEP